jgi:hypothetical protein
MSESDATPRSFKSVVLEIQPGLSDYEIDQYRKAAKSAGIAKHEGWDGGLVVNDMTALRGLVLAEK